MDFIFIPLSTSPGSAPTGFCDLWGLSTYTFIFFVCGRTRAGGEGVKGECTERWCCATPTASASASAAAEPSSASKQHAKVCTEHSALTHSLTHSSCLPFLLLLRSYIHALLSLIPCPPNPTAPPPSSHNREKHGYNYLSPHFPPEF